MPDYERIAEIIKSHRDDADVVTNGTIKFTIKVTGARIAYDLAEHFAQNDSSFDYEEFMQDCGL